MGNVVTAAGEFRLADPNTAYGAGEASLYNPLRSGLDWNSALGQITETARRVGREIGGKVEATIDEVVDFIYETTGIDLSDEVELLEQLLSTTWGPVEGTLGEVFKVLMQFLPFLPGASAIGFDPIAAGATFILEILNPTGLLVLLIGGLINPASIPLLDASKIASGEFPMSMITGLVDIIENVPLIGALVQALTGSTGDLTALTAWSALLPKLTGGLLSAAWIPQIDASKIGSGFINLARLPASVLTTASSIAGSQLTGALNNTVSIGGKNLDALFNGTGQFIGQLNSATTYLGAPLATLLQNFDSTGRFAVSGLLGDITRGMSPDMQSTIDALANMFTGGTYGIPQTTAPTYGSTGVGKAWTSGNDGWSHNVVGNEITVYVTYLASGAPPTFSIGGQNIPVKGTPFVYYTGGGNWTAAVYALMNPPTGPQTVSCVGGAGNLYFAANSVSYSGVGAIGTPATANGTGTSLSHTATPVLSTDLVSHMFAGWISALSGYNRNERWPKAYSSGVNTQMTIGDETTNLTSVPFTATIAPTGAWGSIYLPLSGITTTAHASPTILAAALASIPGSMLTGPLNNLALIGSQTIGALFNGAGQFIGTMNAAASIAGTAANTVVGNASTALANAADIGQGIANVVTGATSSLGSVGMQVVNAYATMFGWLVTQLSGYTTATATAGDVQNSFAVQRAKMGKYTADIEALFAALDSTTDGAVNSLTAVVPFNATTLPAEFTTKSGPGDFAAMYNVAAAPTNKMRAVAVYSAPPPAGKYYYLPIRGDSTFGDCVYLQIGNSSIHLKVRNGVASTVYTFTSATTIDGYSTIPEFRVGTAYAVEVDNDYNFKFDFAVKQTAGLTTVYRSITQAWADNPVTPVSQRDASHRQMGYGTDEAALPGAITQWGAYAPGIQPGAYSTRPATGNEGDVFFPTDSPVISRYTNGAWEDYGPVRRYRRPSNAWKSPVNIGASGAVISTDRGDRLFTIPSAARNWRIEPRSAAWVSGNTVEAEFEISGRFNLGSNLWWAGLLLRNSTSGAFLSFAAVMQSSYLALQVSYWTGPATWSSNQIVLPVYTIQDGCLPKMLRIRDVGGALYFEHSNNNIEWSTVYTIGRTFWLTPDEICWGGSNEGSGYDLVIRNKTFRVY